jgi:myosin-3
VDEARDVFANNLYARLVDYIVGVIKHKISFRRAVLFFKYHEKYHSKSRSDNAPHIYAVADCAYQSALHHQIPQRILLSGESGSGKTTNYLHLTNHLLYLGENKNINLEQITGAIKLIHSLTHASTPINNYSTRCVFKTDIKYGCTGRVSGAIFNVYQLEKWRISSVDM